MRCRVLLLGFVVGTSLCCGACSGEDKEARRRAAGPAPTRAALASVASASAGAALFGRCAACHSIRRGAPDRNGPNLFGVMGKPVGQNSARFGYTAALQQVGGRWTPDRMDAWLANPQRFAPGTSMGFPGLADPLDRADIIAYLSAQR
ncbi:c-type cytochrome [Sphingomonas sp.]|uniref:c-type cytochrome n=1 Tax=Sphingomonas sp. TaxID=28214 RepID=UPI00258A5DC6|nr:c-type cytochrome [Sphingomonas sp.]